MTTTPTSWFNAPPLSSIISVQQGGGAGAQVWGTDDNWQLISNWQDADGTWSGWSEAGWNGAPQVFYGMAAGLFRKGRVHLWVLDLSGQLWETHQLKPGQQEWSPWDGPNWRGSPQFTAIAMMQQYAGHQQLWGAESNSGTLMSTTAHNGREMWSLWARFLGGPYAGTITAAPQANNSGVPDATGQIWITNDFGQLLSAAQSRSGSSWGNWSAPNWQGTKQSFTAIAAATQSGGRLQFWGIDTKAVLWSCYEQKPGRSWSGWTSNWENAGNLIDVTATLLGNGEVQAWAITKGDNNVQTIKQTSAGGGWTAWTTDSSFSGAVV